VSRWTNSLSIHLMGSVFRSWMAKAKELEVSSTDREESA
jgi:hypothetical protein